ncbi:MAG: hypothetical protein P1V36_15890, partial [Planctomycetota bacterium]|nr:hypothetical protein [Planctomycetota bacterium]
GTKGNHWRLVHAKADVTAHGPWPGKSTALNSPWDIEFLDGVGYIAMAGSHSMWAVDPDTYAVRHVAGDLSERRLDAQDPYEAAFAQPSGLTTDGTYLYIADSESSAILRMSKGGEVVTLAGAEKDAPKNLFHFGDEDGVGWGKRFQHPLGVEYVNGHVWVADSYNHKLKRLEPKRRTVRSMVGTGVPGQADGQGAMFAEPSGVSYAGGVLYVADTNNHAIRRLRLPPGGTEVGMPDTLPLRGVPIPMAHAQGGLPDAWPMLAGTLQGQAVKAAVRVGAPFEITLALRLPPGWKLTEDAPSAARVEVPASLQPLVVKAVEAKITKPTTTIRVPGIDHAGVHEVPLRVLYYVCREGGDCRMRSVEFTLQVAVSAEAEAPASIQVTDIFTPAGK